MPEYKYRAKKGPVDMVEGLIEAVTEEEAIEKISQLGLLPVHLEPRVSDDSQKAAVSRGYSGRVRPREITLFFKTTFQPAKIRYSHTYGVGYNSGTVGKLES
jgi:type II secretory pathway component PulF